MTAALALIIAIPAVIGWIASLAVALWMAYEKHDFAEGGFFIFVTTSLASALALAGAYEIIQGGTP